MFGIIVVNGLSLRIVDSHLVNNGENRTLQNSNKKKKNTKKKGRTEVEMKEMCIQNDKRRMYDEKNLQLRLPSQPQWQFASQHEYLQLTFSFHTTVQG